MGRRPPCAPGFLSCYVPRLPQLRCRSTRECGRSVNASRPRRREQERLGEFPCALSFSAGAATKKKNHYLSSLFHSILTFKCHGVCHRPRLLVLSSCHGCRPRRRFSTSVRTVEQ